MTYSKNINSLKRNIGLRSSEFSNNTKQKIQNINNSEKEQIENFQNLTKLLIGDNPSQSFLQGRAKSGNQGQGGIPWAYGNRVRKKKIEGEQALIEDEKDKVEKAAILQAQLSSLKTQNLKYFDVKKNMLLNGAYYEDSDRFTKLSPHAQSFYAQAKLGLYKEKVTDLLTHWFVKAENPLSVKGMQFTPKSTFGAHSDPLIFKQHALNVGLQEIRSQNGIDGYSDEIQLLAGITGVNGAEQNAINSLMGKFRKQNAIYTSNQTLQELILEMNLNPDDIDFNSLIARAEFLVNSEGEFFGNAGALDAIFAQLLSMGINGDLPDELLKKIKAMPNTRMPQFAGKTWGESHEGRFKKLEGDIEKGIKLGLDNLLLKDQNRRNKFEVEFKEWLADWYKNNPGKLMDRRTLGLWFAKGYNELLFNSWPAYMTEVWTAQSQNDNERIENLLSIYELQGYITPSDLWGASQFVKDWARFGGPNDNGKGLLIKSNESGTNLAYELLENKGTTGVPKVIEKLIQGIGVNFDEQPVLFRRIDQNAKEYFVNRFQYYVQTQGESPAAAEQLALKDIKDNIGDKKAENIFYRTAEPATDLYREIRTKTKETIDKGLVKHGDTRFLTKTKLELPDGVLEQTIQYFEGKARMPKFLLDLADLYPSFSANQLANWQMIAHGIKKPEELGVKEPIQNAAIALDLPLFNETARRLQFKPTSCSTMQAACLVNYQKSLLNRGEVYRPETDEVGDEGASLPDGHSVVPTGKLNESQQAAVNLRESIDLKAKQETDTTTLTNLVRERLDGDKSDESLTAQIRTSTSLPADQEIINQYYGGGVTYATGGTSDNYANLKYTLAQQLGLLNAYPTSGQVTAVETATGVKQNISNLQPSEIDHTRANEIVEQLIMYTQDPTSVQFIGDKEVTPLTGDYSTDMGYTWVQEKINSGEWQLIPLLNGEEIDPKNVITEKDVKNMSATESVIRMLGPRGGGSQLYVPSMPIKKEVPKYEYRIIHPEVNDDTANILLSPYSVAGSPYLNDDLQAYSGQLIAMNLGSDPTVPLNLESAKTDLEKWNYVVNIARQSGAKFPELIAAQFMLESGRGTKVTGTNNYFGLKTTEDDTNSTVLPTREWEGGKWITVDAPFKNFESPEDAINYLSRLWYHDFGEYNGINNATNITEAANLLVQEGYATDPKYAKKLLTLIKEFQKLRQREKITV